MPSQISPSIASEHWKIHTGKMFSVPISNTNIQKLAYKITTPANVSAHCVVDFCAVVGATSSGTFQVATGMGGDFANTAITPQNHLLGGAASVVTVSYDADGTFTPSGVVFFHNFCASGGAGPMSGELSSRSQEVIVPPNSTYYLVIDLNQVSGVGNPFCCTLDFYEDV